MTQLNMQVSERFAQMLRDWMRVTGTTNKSEAIRLAVEEGIRRRQSGATADFRSWIGIGNKASVNKKPRFRDEADLWE